MPIFEIIYDEKRKRKKQVYSEEYLDRIDKLFDYFNYIATSNEACWQYLLRLLVWNGYRCPKCSGSRLRLNYTQAEKLQKIYGTQCRQHTYCYDCHRRIPSIATGHGYQLQDTIFAEQKMSLHDLFWLAFSTVSFEELQPSQAMNIMLSKDPEHPTRYSASNKWRKRIVQRLHIDTTKRLEGDIQVRKQDITAVFRANIIYGMKAMNRNDAQAYRYMVFPNNEELGMKGQGEENLKIFLRKYVDGSKATIHTSWKRPGLNLITSKRDPQFTRDFLDFKEYFVQSYKQKAGMEGADELLLDAAGLYHFSKDNPIEGTFDEGKEPMENNNMIRFNKFVLREYDQILNASVAQWESKKLASGHSL